MKLNKEIVKKLQSYLTEEEANRIIPLYKKNYDSNFGNLDITSQASDIIINGFLWETSLEGNVYWDSVHLIICEREEGE